MIVQTGWLASMAKIEFTQLIVAAFCRFPASVDCWKLAKIPEGKIPNL